MSKKLLRIINSKEFFSPKDKKLIFFGKNLTKHAMEACSKLIIDPNSLIPK